MRKKDDSGRFIRVPMEDRFWEKVDRSAGTFGCWLWTSTLEWNGYGRFTDYWDKYLAHRWSYRHLVGPIPKGKQVMHSCDNPPCVNPRHLSVGTASDNMQDARRKGWQPNSPPPPAKGEAAWNHKLTAAQVAEIRSRYVPRPPGRPRKGVPAGPSVRELAKEYGVASSLIHRIIQGVSWPHD